MIHQYRMNNYNIILDIYSGSVHVVDDVVYDILELYKHNDLAYTKDIICKRHNISEEEFFDCIHDIEQLEDEGLLYAPNPMYVPKEDNEPQVIKALCLHVAHTCNLNCEYCFASQGNYAGPRSVMSLETGKRAIDFLVENSGKRHNLEVDFFGGEPLLNWEVCKQVVQYARSLEKKHNKNFRFTLTTNGMLIDDDVIDFSNKEMDNVVLSLDGRKHVHDRLRKDNKGMGSYDKIIPKFQEFVKRRTKGTYYIRGTFTAFNVDFLQDILHMADLGFTELSMEPVVCPPSDPYALTEEHLPLLLEQYELLALEMLNRHKNGNPFNFYHYNIDLTSGPCMHKRTLGCGSGSEYLAVTPWGELFPCHQFVNNNKFSMGNIYEGVKNTDLKDEFKSCNINTKEECENCWAKLYCAGGCAANSYNATGSILDNYEYGCTLLKKRIECAIMLKIAKQDL